MTISDEEMTAAMDPAERKRIYLKAWNEKNKERQAAKKKAYYEANKEKLKAAVKANYEANREDRLAAMKAWYEGHRDKVLAEKKEYYEENQAHIRTRAKKHIVDNPRAAATDLVMGRARMNGREADREYLESLPCPTHCPILGTPIEFRRGEGTRDPRNTASFDRIDSAHGYVKGNVQIISKLANSMKQNANIEEMRAFAAWVSKTYGN